MQAKKSPRFREGNSLLQTTHKRLVAVSFGARFLLSVFDRRNLIEIITPGELLAELLAGPPGELPDEPLGGPPDEPPDELRAGLPDELLAGPPDALLAEPPDELPDGLPDEPPDELPDEPPGELPDGWPGKRPVTESGWPGWPSALLSAG
jgi:hypothetical protein